MLSATRDPMLGGGIAGRWGGKVLLASFLRIVYRRRGRTRESTKAAADALRFQPLRAIEFRNASPMVSTPEITQLIRTKI